MTKLITLRELNLQNANRVYKGSGVVLNLFNNIANNKKEEISLGWLDKKENDISSDTQSDQLASETSEGGTHHPRRNAPKKKWEYIAMNRDLEEQLLERKVDVDELIRHYEDKIVRAKLYKELCIYILFLILFLIYLFNQRSVEDCWEMEFGLTDLFFDEEFPDEYSHIYKSFFQVGSTKEFYQWLKGPLHGALQGDEEDPPYLYRANVQVGAVRIRQLRVESDDCEMPSDYKKLVDSSDCYPSYTNSRKSTKIYGENGSLFKYQDEEESGSNSVWGKLVSSYEGGGFIVDIPKNSTSDEFLTEIEKLENNGFIDRATRAIVLNIYMYNVNTNYFADIMPVFEFGVGGNVYPWYKFRVFRLDMYETLSDAGRAVVEILLFLFLIYYVIALVADLKDYHKKGGILLYFKDTWNLLDLFNLILFWLIFIFQFNYLIDKDRQDIVIDDLGYVPLSRLADKYLMLYNIIGFNIFITIIKIFKFLKMNRRMLLVWDTLSKASPDLIVFFAFFLIIFIAFAVMGFVLFGPENQGYRDFASAITSCFKMSLGDIEYQELQEINRFLGPIFFFLFSILVIFTLMSMFLAIIDNSYDLDDMGGSTSDIKQLFATTFSIMKGGLIRIGQKLSCSKSEKTSSAERLNITTRQVYDKLNRIRKGTMRGKRLRMGQIRQMTKNDPKRDILIQKIDNDTKDFENESSNSESDNEQNTQIIEELEKRKNERNREIGDLHSKLDFIIKKIKSKEL
ncbi:polycystin family member [Anaeramoeba flamelloides]|uniref:Polycystin family member n=1 Tax=Anaeramoeba flamelloides TaxID=1746091 RepID=A0AAV7YUL5_9EUKA|nr:polycystin family member [Anaeramoeba flamelloides]